ncbi:MAG: hypothetical protein B6D55_04835 [Candidatus Omnitrophica bacterium 4484_70.2]|nr:MAG: hypothetical protein B6D55_04835 [Candidatus Omnitrophica bacterium 4484_70.2]
MRRIYFIFTIICFSLFLQEKISFSFSENNTFQGTQNICEKEKIVSEVKKETTGEGEIIKAMFSAYYTYLSLSPIEKMFNDSEKVNKYERIFSNTKIVRSNLSEETFNFQKLDKFPILRQFGYKTFLISPTTFTPVENLPVRGDYVLGPGDEIIIDVWGMIENRYDLVLNREGSVFIPKIGKVYLQGLTLNQAKKLIKEKFTKYYKKFQLSVSMGTLRTVKVFVIGEVNRPGGYELPSLATLFTALYAAGGPTKMGSLRNIRLIRNNKVITIADFYNFLIYGDKKEDRRLFSGDTIFVPPIGDTVAISGDIVKRPGIYEIKESISLKELINLAGGTLPFGFNCEVIVKNLRENKESKKYSFSSTSEVENLKIEGGTIVRIFANVLPQREKTMFVEIKGEVKLPGIYKIERGEKLSSVLRRAGGYTEEAFLKGAVFSRVSVKKMQQELINKFIHQSQQMILTQISSLSLSPEKGISEKMEVLREMNQLISSISSKIPLGRVFIKLDEIDKLKDSSYDLILRDGDTLYIPEPPMSVSVVGGVRNPGAVVYLPEKTVDYYIEKCGGFSENADIRNIYIIKADGTAVTKFARLKKIEQGDMVIVPEKMKLRGWALTKEIIEIFYKIAMPVAVYSR